VFTIDDGRKGEDDSIRIINDWVDFGIFDDVKIFSKLLMVSEVVEDLSGIHLGRGRELSFLGWGLVLISERLFTEIKGLEDDIFGLLGIIDEGTLNAVQIVGTNSNQSSLSADIVMELVLEINETLINTLGEFEVSEDSTNDERSDLASSLGDGHLFHFFGGDKFILGRFSHLQIVGKGFSNTFSAEKVISIGGNFEDQFRKRLVGCTLLLFILFLVAFLGFFSFSGSLLLLCSLLVILLFFFLGLLFLHLDTELEAELLKFLKIHGLAEEIEEILSVNVDSGHGCGFWDLFCGFVL